MEKILRYIAEQNKYFDPKDSLSLLINEELSSSEGELNEDDLFFVQAARGPEAHKPAGPRKGKD